MGTMRERFLPFTGWQTCLVSLLSLYSMVTSNLQKSWKNKTLYLYSHSPMNFSSHLLYHLLTSSLCMFFNFILIFFLNHSKSDAYIVALFPPNIYFSAYFLRIRTFSCTTTVQPSTSRNVKKYIYVICLLYSIFVFQLAQF